MCGFQLCLYILEDSSLTSHPMSCNWTSLPLPIVYLIRVARFAKIHKKDTDIVKEVVTFILQEVRETRHSDILAYIQEPYKSSSGVIQVEGNYYKFWRDVLEKDWKIVDKFFESCMNQKDFNTLMSPSIAVRYMYFSEIFHISYSYLICGHVSESQVG